MRTKQKAIDYGAISRASVRRDFSMAQLHTKKEKRSQNENSQELGEVKRISFVNENSQYYRLRSYLVGKLVRLVERSDMGCWYCEFINDDDRKAMNAAGQWSDNKCRYLLDGVKYKD